MCQSVNLPPAVVSTIQSFSNAVSNLEFDVENLYFYARSAYGRSLLGQAAEYVSDLGYGLGRMLPAEGSPGDPHLVPLALKDCSLDLETLAGVLDVLAATSADDSVALAYAGIVARVRDMGQRAKHLAATTMDDES